MSESSPWVKPEDVPAYLEKGWRLKKFGPTLSELSPAYAAAYDEFIALAEAGNPRAAELWEFLNKLGNAIREELRSGQ